MDWKGIIATICAIGLSATLIIGVAAAAWNGRPLGDKGGEVLIGIFVAMGAILSAYIARNNHNDNNKRDN